MFGKVFTFILLVFAMQNSCYGMRIEEVWDPVWEKQDEKSMEIDELYKQADGYKHWKCHGKYFMTQAFWERFLQEGNDFQSPSVFILRAWIGKTLTEDAFFEIWDEDIRDKAGKFTGKVIAYFQAKLPIVTDKYTKEEVEAAISHLTVAQRSFGEIIEFRGHQCFRILNKHELKHAQAE
jgi:hypothetical protein